jgi:uncharacterized OB-fold protein
MSTPYRGALPQPTPETRPYWDAAREGRLVLPWCEACGQPHFYPRALCPHCGGARLSWRQASGRGRLHTYVINHKAAKGFEERVPYVIAVVELEEGPRLMTNIEIADPTPEALRIDMPVEVAFRMVTREVTLPVFRPAP